MSDEKCQRASQPSPNLAVKLVTVGFSRVCSRYPMMVADKATPECLDGPAVFQVGRNPGRPQRIRDA